MRDCKHHGDEVHESLYSYSSFNRKETLMAMSVTSSCIRPSRTAHCERGELARVLHLVGESQIMTTPMTSFCTRSRRSTAHRTRRSRAPCTCPRRLKITSFSLANDVLVCLVRGTGRSAGACLDVEGSKEKEKKKIMLTVMKRAPCRFCVRRAGPPRSSSPVPWEALDAIQCCA